MRESKFSFRRFMDYQDYGTFVFEKGINVFGESANNPTCLNCGYEEAPIEVQEVLLPDLSERRKKFQTSYQLYAITKDFL